MGVGFCVLVAEKDRDAAIDHFTTPRGGAPKSSAALSKTTAKASICRVSDSSGTARNFSRSRVTADAGVKASASVRCRAPMTPSPGRSPGFSRRRDNAVAPDAIENRRPAARSSRSWSPPAPHRHWRIRRRRNGQRGRCGSSTASPRARAEDLHCPRQVIGCVPVIELRPVGRIGHFGTHHETSCTHPTFPPAKIDWPEIIGGNIGPAPVALGRAAESVCRT